VELVECLVMLYKFTKDRFFDSFIFYVKICDTETLHRKFGIIRKSIYEILTELHQSLLDANFISHGEEMERLVNYKRSDALGPENLSFVIGSFEKYGLRKYVEPIIDFLWRLFSVKLPLLYPEYAHLSREGKLNDWRDIVREKIGIYPTRESAIRLLMILCNDFYLLRRQCFRLIESFAVLLT
jgi:hypothetical protein